MESSNKVMGKEKSMKQAAFAHGGAQHMFGQQHAGRQNPSHTGHDVEGGSQMFAKGGSTRMFGRQHADQSCAGSTSGKGSAGADTSSGTGGGRVTQTQKRIHGGGRDSDGDYD